MRSRSPFHHALAFVLTAALILALLPSVVGAASKGDPLLLGEANLYLGRTNLRGKATANLVIINDAGIGGTTLDLRVQKGNPPFKVNTSARVSLLNADFVDGLHASAFLQTGAKAADSDLLDGIDSDGYQTSLAGTVCPLGIPMLGFDPSGDPICREPDITRVTVAPADDVGNHAMALNALGHPVIAYPHGDLKLVTCNDPACAGGDETISILSDWNVGKHYSLLLDSTGNPVISFARRNLDDDLRVVRCGNPTCDPGVWLPETVDSTGDVGQWNSVALNGDYPVISYYDATNGDLKLAACNDARCVGGGERITTIDSTGNVGAFTSLVLTASGNPIISYYDLTNDDLKVAACNDPLCDGGGDRITTVDSTGDVGAFSSLMLNASGNPVIAYVDATNDALKVAACNDPKCSGGDETITTVDSTGDRVEWVSLDLNALGHPVIAYYYFTISGEGDLRVVACNDPACVGGDETITTVDSDSVGSGFTSLALRDSWHPVIAYLYYPADPADRAIKVATIR